MISDVMKIRFCNTEKEEYRPITKMNHLLYGVRNSSNGINSELFGSVSRRWYFIIVIRDVLAIIGFE